MLVDAQPGYRALKYFIDLIFLFQVGHSDLSTSLVVSSVKKEEEAHYWQAQWKKRTYFKKIEVPGKPVER